jgi:hypothetical protein
MMLLADSGTTFLDYASRGGVIGLLAIILYGGFKKEPWWVFGWVYRDLESRYERRGVQLDKWWETARKATITAEALAQTRLPSGDGQTEGTR